MKIAAYTNSMDGSGARRVFFEFIRHLAQSGHEVDLYHLSGTPIQRFPFTEYVSNIYTYPLEQFKDTSISPYIISLLVNPVRKLFYLRQLKAVSEKICLDINDREYDFAFLDVCNLLRVSYHLRYLKMPSVIYLHHPKREAYEPIRFMASRFVSSPDQPWFVRIYKKISAFLYHTDNLITAHVSKINVQHASLVLSNSYYTREYIYKVYGVLAKVIYPGVDISRFKHLNLKRKPYVMSVGGIEENKGFDYIVRALARIPDDKRPSLTLVAGRRQPRIYNELVASAKEKKVRLSIVENISDDELIRLYNEATAVVFAPMMEPFGLVALESMSCGTPVIGVREAGLRESIVDGETGILVDRDEEELAEAILMLTESEALRERLSRNAVEYVREKWNWDKAFAKFDACIRKLLMKKCFPA